MRISLIKGDAGYNPALAKLARVFLNGEEISGVYMADEEQGVVYVHLRDASGQIFLDLEGKNVMCDIKRGVVKIVLEGLPLTTPEEDQE